MIAYVFHHMYFYTTLPALSLQVQQCAETVTSLQTEAAQLVNLTAQAVTAQTTCEKSKMALEAQLETQAQQHQRVPLQRK
jgi:hypothetical protein